MTGIKMGSLRKIYNLFTKGINTKNTYGETRLHWAVENGYTEIVKALIAKGADINTKDIYGQTPLHLATRNGHTEIVKALLDASADVHMKNIYGQTPLHFATRNGYTEIAKALIAKGADVHTKNIYGETPLRWANENGELCPNQEKPQKEIYNLLMGKGDKYGDTTLHVAASHGDGEMAAALFEQGADVNAQNEYGNTPLHLAAQAV